MKIFCSVIFVTHNRPDSLERALLSLKKCKRIDEVEVIVVENGPDAEKSSAVTKAFTSSASCMHFHTTDKSLAKARNMGAKQATGELLCFFDDDVEFEDHTLEAYILAAQKNGSQYFFGGPVVPLYETEPLYWVKGFLPPSALGFSLGPNETEIQSARFIGNNCVFHKEAMLSMGGFPEYLGTTENYSAMAEETVLQTRLLKNKYRGIFVPNGGIRHHVPTNNCSFEFALLRSYRLGLTNTLVEHVEKIRIMPKRTPMWVYRNIIELKLLLTIKKLLRRPEPQIAPELILLEEQKGILDGFKYLRTLNLIERYAPK